MMEKEMNRFTDIEEADFDDDTSISEKDFFSQEEMFKSSWGSLIELSTLITEYERENQKVPE